MIDTQNNTQGIDFRSVQDLNAKTSDKKLGQEDFLRLMNAQLQNQDPMSPLENNEFMNQIAQFSMVEGIGDLNQSFGELSNSLVSNQALQASNLVGRSVLAPTGVATLVTGGSVQGKVELPAASSDVTVKVYDNAGQVIRNLELGSQAAGMTDFQWDGLKNDGSFANPGTYFVSAEANVEGQTEAIETLVASEVRSVTLSDSGGLLLDLAGLGTIDFKDVREIL